MPPEALLRGAGATRFAPGIEVQGALRPPDAARAQWLAGGSFSLPVPVDTVSPEGMLTIVGEDMRLFEDSWDIVHEDGSTEFGGAIVSVAIRGEVLWQPTSLALLLLGEHGVYGTVDVIGGDGLNRRYEFEVGDPNQEGATSLLDQVVQLTIQPQARLASEPVGTSVGTPPILGQLPNAHVVDLVDLPAFWTDDEALLMAEPVAADQIELPVASSFGPDGPSAVADPTAFASLTAEAALETLGEAVDPIQVTAAIPTGYGSSCSFKQFSTVRFYAEYSLWTTQSNWLDRMQSGFQQYVAAFVDVCISAFTLSTGSLSFNLLTTDRCDGSSNVRVQFSNWLFNSNTARNNIGWHAYQLWTKRDLTSPDPVFPDDYMCFGLARSDSTFAHLPISSRPGVAHLAASVIEGWDNNDLDLYDPDESDERGIVSGHELGHVYGEANHPNGTCNNGFSMMKNDIDKDLARPCFVLSSKLEIKNWFFGGVV